MSRPRPTSILDPEGLLDAEERAARPIALPETEEEQGPYPPGTFRKIGLGIVTLVALVVLTYVVPPLWWARPWTFEDPVPFWNLVGREFLGEAVVTEDAAEQVEAAEAIAKAVEQEDAEERPIEDVVVVTPPEDDRLPPYEPHADDSEAVPQSLELSKTTDLDPFFERLAQTDAGYEQAITRVVHWGDSVIANDNVTSTLRKQMQRRFGDAGHGFHLLAKPNASYRHRGVRFSTNDGWQRCYIINHCKKDGRYGLGGTTVWSAGGGESRYRTATETSYGRKVSRYEIWYAGEPKGGKIRLRVDDGEPEVIETEAPELEDRLHTIELEDGPHELEVRAAGGGRVRLYGVVMERDVPGVVWDGMAQLGAFTSRMLYFDQDHIRGQIARRDPGLLVFQFGGNDLLLSGKQLPQFKQDFAAVLQEFRSEDDPVACLVVSPVDHGNRRSGRIESDRMVPRITDIQRDVALAEGCAFFDTLAAMGGEGAVARWRRAKPPLISGDLAHLTNPGQGVLGHMIYLALMESYREYRVRTDGPVRFPAGAGSGR